MRLHSRPVAPILAIALAGLLAACATPPAPSSPSTIAKAQEDSVDEADTITGSRIPRKSTDRLLHKTGAAGAKEMERNAPPQPGPRSN